jgi:DUF4097 and DUF4098 domain-containing protein YvlB
MADPLRLKVSTRKGSVRVVPAADAELSVEGGNVVGEYEGVQDIRRAEGAKTIVVHCPPGTDVTVGTTSGSVETEGKLGAVRIATVSGKVHVADVDRVDVRTKSGSVKIGRVDGECRVIVTSGKIHIESAQRATIAGVSGVVVMDGVEGADVKTVSGKVLIGTTGRGTVNVRTVSGVVEVKVPRDIQPMTRLGSISGRIRCECPTGHDGEIAVKSVSGSIRVSCE